MMDDEPLDFEKEDALLVAPTLAQKRRKVILLDDLLEEFYTEKKQRAECQIKVSSLSKNYNSDEEDEKTQKLSELVDTFQRQFDEMNAEDDIPSWGLRVFGPQKTLPPQTSDEELRNSQLLQPLLTDEFISVINPSEEQGESFLEGLLANGWLSNLVLVSGSIEDSVAMWSFNKMLYSSNRELQLSACKLWCEILLAKSEADRPSIQVRWFPKYSLLKEALGIYGFLYDSSNISSLPSQASFADPESEGPPENIISWIKVISSFCQIRSIQTIFSICEAEELVIITIHLFLDRQLQGLSVHLSECLLSILNFFTEEEWEVSCQKVAEHISQKIPKDLNSLKAVECISAADNRSRKLRSEIALHILMCCFDKKVNNFEEVLSLLVTINVKGKGCDFFRLFLYLVLGENVLLSHGPSREKSLTYEMWRKYLRNCSSQITSTDWRSYASKVRNKASYLCQSAADHPLH